jgi:hypothetical protein
MARHRNTQRPKFDSPTLPIAQDTIPPTGKVQQLFKRLIDSGVDTAFEHFWIGIALVVVAAGTALWFYWRSGKALWLYPWLYFFGGFSTAAILVIAISVLLLWIRSKRNRTLKLSNDLKYKSKDKGYLDHIIYRDRSFEGLTATLNLISAEIANVGKTSEQGTAQINAIRARPSAEKLLRISTRVAERYERHSMEMEKHLGKLEATIDLLIESNIGYLKWFTPSTEEQVQQLKEDRQSMLTLRSVNEESLKGIRGFRQSQLSLTGQSQELNSAINRLVDVTDGIMAVMTKAHQHWGEMIAIMDSKLVETS